MKNKEIQLGQQVKDIVTGFNGIAVAKIEHLNGCVQYAVRPKQKASDKDMPEACYIDVEQLEIVGDGINKKKKVTKTGGPKGLAFKNNGI
jgi:hypothetical protein